jgi:hypothetical protein
MDQLAEEYRGRAAFLFVYGPEAHPEGADLPESARTPLLLFKQADTYAERQAAARYLQKTFAVGRRILVDEMGATSLWERFLPGSGLSNPVVVVGRDGKVVFAMGQLHAETLHGFLANYLANR